MAITAKPVLTSAAVVSPVLTKATFPIHLAVKLLHDAVDSVCPNDGSVIGDPLDVSTWKILPLPSATKNQIAAAQKIISTLDPTKVKETVILIADFFKRMTSGEQTAMWTAAQKDPAIFGQIMMWLSVGRVDLVAKETIDKINVMVAAKIIVADRAVVILTP